MSSDKGGFTLVELVMAMAIMFIVFLGLTGIAMTGLEYNIQNVLRDEAVNVGETRMNEVRSLPFDNIVTPGTPVSVTRAVRGLNAAYTVTTTVAAPDVDLKQVTMVVAWTRHGKPYTHTFSSLVRRR
ncbi:MAG: type IV pilus modification PilV family protein [Gemmatimonadota bacterium]